MSLLKQKNTNTFYFGLMLLAGCGAASAGTPAQWSIGAKLHGSTWTTENKATGQKAEAEGGQLGVSLKMQKGAFYSGLSFTGGDFEFTDRAPTHPVNGATPTPTTIKHGEADLIFGYYFWPQVSLFLDLKSVSNEGDDYEKVTYGGIGYGISGYHRLTDQWTLFGSFGVVPMRIRVADDNIGDTGRSALEFGLSFTPSQRLNLSASIRSQGQRDEYDSGLKQEQHIGALAFGANLTF